LPEIAEMLLREYHAGRLDLPAEHWRIGLAIPYSKMK
jgi:hypothetical protein